MKTRKVHDRQVEEIIKRIQKNSFQFAPKKTFSNTMRNLNYSSIRKKLGVDQLSEVIEVNLEENMVLVEPGCPMDKLALECSKFNLMVPVMPEFKGITVGGAINGAAIESSSFRFGQFNDVCEEFEVLLGNGDLVKANSKEHADLFYGMSGSYGSLGIITLVKVKLIERKPFVELQYHRFEEISKGIDYLNQQTTQKDAPEFVEGLIFDCDNIVIIKGNLKEKIELNINAHPIPKNCFKPFFYEHVKNTSLPSEFMKTEDYLFRHDLGAFWMGAYGANLKLFFRYFLENQCHLKSLSKKLFGPLKKERDSKLKTPSFIFRLCIGWWMKSRTLYKMVHMNSESWFKKNFIIQDYYIPAKNSNEFIDLAIQETNIFPLWLCPVLATYKPQIFSPHYLINSKENEQTSQFIDIGIYGMPNSSLKLDTINQILDRTAKNLEGKKTFIECKSFFFFISSKSFIQDLTLANTLRVSIVDLAVWCWQC